MLASTTTAAAYLLVDHHSSTTPRRPPLLVGHHHSSTAPSPLTTVDFFSKHHRSPLLVGHHHSSTAPSPSRKQLAYETQTLRVPEIQWLGVFPSDAERYRVPQQCLLPMTSEDRMKTEAILNRCYLQRVVPEWRMETRYFLIHYKSLGDYVTLRDGRMAGKYKGDVNQIYGEDTTSHPIIDETLWKQASGGSKKGRIYGFGNTRDPNLVLTGVPSGGYASGASSSDTRIQALEVRLQQSEQAREKDLEEMHRQEEVLKKEMADMRQIDEIRMKEMEEIRQIEEVRKKEYQDMMELVKRLSQSQFTPSQFPPPPP